MGRWHAHTVVHAGGRVAAVVDHDAGRRTKLAERHRGARAFSELREALDSCDASVIHLCTPLETRTALALDALSAGRHVLVEKPFAPSVADAESILTLADVGGRLAVPVHQFPFQPAVQQARARLRSMGTLRQLEFAVSSSGAAPNQYDDVALGILPHFLSLCAFFSSVRIVDGDWHLKRTAPGELLVTAVLGELGAVGRISMRGRPPLNELRLIGEQDTTFVDLFHGFAVVDSAPLTTVAKVLRPFRVAARQGIGAALNLGRRAARREPAYPGLRSLVAAFHRAARGAGPSPISPSETRDNIRVWTYLRGLA